MSLILITGCPNHKIRHELRAFRRSEVTLSFELERVLDRNIGIGPPEAALGLSVIDVDACEAIFLKAGQPFTDSLTGWYQRMLARNARKLLSPRSAKVILSVGATKTLMHNAVMLDRLNSLSVKYADRRLNNTDFKELLFYGLRTAG